MDLIVRNARLADRSSGELIDIGVEQGRIVALEHALASEAEVYDAKGCLACPGLIETHIHLDKSRIIDRCAPQERKTLSPVKGVSPLKKSMLPISRSRDMTRGPTLVCTVSGTRLIGSGIDVLDKYIGTDLWLNQHCRICRRCAAVDV